MSNLALRVKRFTGFGNGVNRTVSTEHFSDTEVRKGVTEKECTASFYCRPLLAMKVGVVYPVAIKWLHLQ